MEYKRVITVTENLEMTLVGKSMDAIPIIMGTKNHMPTSVLTYNSEKSSILYGNINGVIIKKTEDTRFMNDTKIAYAIIGTGIFAFGKRFFYHLDMYGLDSRFKDCFCKLIHERGYIRIQEKDDNQ